MRDETAQFLQDQDKKSQMTAKKFKNSIQNASRILTVKACDVEFPSKLCSPLEFYFIRMWVLIEGPFS